MRLCAEFLDAVVHLARHKCERDDSRNVHFGAEHVHVEIELLANRLDVLETFLVVWTSTADPDLDLVLVEEWSDFPESADDTLESRCDLKEIVSSIRLVSVILSSKALTFVKLAIPPPMKRTLPSGCCGARSMRSRTVRA